MKQLFIFLVVLLPFLAKSQTVIYGKYKYTDSLTFAKYKNNNSGDSVLSVDNQGRLKLSYNHTIDTTGKWIGIGWLPSLVKYSDTAFMLSPYLRKIDTTGKWLGAGWYSYLVKYSDTANMLSPYQRSLTAVKYSDTASMLANYRTGIIALNADTVYQAAQIAARVKYTDTASMLSPYARDNNVVHLTGNESIGGNKTFSYNTIFNGQITSNIYGITINNSSLVGAGIYATNITANRTIYLPDNSGTFALTSDTTNKWISLGWLPSLVKYSDTSSMLSPYARTTALGSYVKYTDTASMLSPYGRLNYINTQLATKVNYTDTASMLSPYYRTATANAALALKVNYTDTASMLNNYLNGIIALNADTIYQAAQIAARVKYSDTAAMLAPYTRSVSGGYLPLSGGTLTGNLNGTTANFTGFVSANGFQSAVTGVAGGSTTNMTSSSSQNWYITSGAPTTTTIVLPNATTIAIGNTYQFNNNATGGLAIQQYGGGALYTVPSGGYVEVILLSNSFSAGQWDVHVFFPSNSTAGTAGFSTTGTINSSGLDTYTSNLGSSYTSRTKVDKNYIDSSRGVDVKYSDTASMLNNYRTGIIALNADTATIQPRFNNVLGVVATKVNYTDTASMLNNYRTGIVALNADTATIQPRFNNVLGVTALKVNYTDTASMLAGYKTFYPRNAISLTTTGTSGAATYTTSTGVLNIPQYQAAGTYVTSVTGTSPISSSGGTTPAISISQATTSSNGYLSSTDWNTFNNKQNALTNPVTGTGTTNYITKWTGTNTVNTSTAYDDGTGFMVNTTTNGGRRFVVYSASADNQMAVTGTGPSIRFADNIASPTYSALYGMATQSNNYITGAVAGDFAITWNSANNLLLGYSNTSTEKARLTSSGNFLINTQSDAGYKLQVNGTGYFSSSVTASSIIKSGGTSTQYLMADGSTSTLTNPVTGTGTTNYLPKFTGASAIGNSNLINDASGNLGLGVTPSAWGTSYNRFAIELSTGGSSVWAQNFGGSNPSMQITCNSYESATGSIYKVSAPASYYQQNAGSHQWYNAPSGTAGNTITFTQAMTLTPNGNLLVGTTTDAGYKLDVNGTGRFTGALTAINATFNGSGYGSNGVTASGANGGHGVQGTGGGSGGRGVFGTSNDVSGYGGYFSHTAGGTALYVSGAATFSSSVTATSFNGSLTGSYYSGATYSFEGLYGSKSTTNGGALLQFLGHAGATSSQGFSVRYDTDADAANLLFQWSSPQSSYSSLTYSTIFKLGAGGAATFSSLGTGTVYSNSGTLTNTNPSDSTLKNTITPLGYGLNEIMQLQPKTFYYNSDSSKSSLKYGFIAQDVAKIMPDMVRKIEPNNPDSKLGLESDGIYVTLVNAIKELQQEIQDLKKQIKN